MWVHYFYHSASHLITTESLLFLHTIAGATTEQQLEGSSEMFVPLTTAKTLDPSGMSANSAIKWTLNLIHLFLPLLCTRCTVATLPPQWVQDTESPYKLVFSYLHCAEYCSYLNN